MSIHALRSRAPTRFTAARKAAPPAGFVLATSALVAVFLAVAGTGALAQSHGNGNGGPASGVSAAGSGGGSDRVIVCTGCADPNSYLKGNKLVSGPVAAYPPPRPPKRPSQVPRTALSENCYLVRNVLADGRTIIARDCGTPVQTTW